MSRTTILRHLDKLFPHMNHEEENNTQDKSALFSAIIKAVAETKDILADSNNPFHKSKYASLSAHLSALKPIFAKHKLGIIQFPVSRSGYGDKSEWAIGVNTVIIHENGTSISNECVIPCDSDTNGQDAGSIITYLRRYGLASVAGVATDDDDAEASRVAKTAYKAQAKPQTASQPTPQPNIQQAIPQANGTIDPSMTLPFGKSKGLAIGDIGIDDLKYWATVWEPRPYEKTGRVSQKDTNLKATAVALYQNATGEQEPAEEDGVPF